MKEFYERANNILHRVMRVVDDIDKGERESKARRDKEIKSLLLCRQELLELVEMQIKENGDG